MPYSIDLRERVVGYVHKGGSKAEAARRFGVSEGTVYNWLKRENLAPTKVSRRHRKLDWSALEKHVQQYPSATLKERAKHFEVNPHAIWYALRQLKITRKKQQKYLERDHEDRQLYLRRLQKVVKVKGFENIAYSGFHVNAANRILAR